MISGRAVRLCILSAVAVLVTALSCGSPPPPATTTRSEVASTRTTFDAPGTRQDDKAAYVATPPVEAGFSHCCGDLQYKMEVACGDRLKRCYVFENGDWKQTFGRHCKTHLSETCYLHTCDDVCDGQ